MTGSSAFPQTMLHCALQELNFKEQEQLASEMSKQRKISFFEIEPHPAITLVYSKVMTVVCKLIPLMNERGYMQGTFVTTMP